MIARHTLPRRRADSLRRLAWLSAVSLLAFSALAPASVAAANPQPQDVACNNIESGGRSPDYVWVTLGAAGLTVNWATDAAHFDAGNFATVTVRACVFDSNGTDKGGIDQDTENDGHQLFSWSLLGYETNPCPDSSLSFGGSADSTAVQTKKSDIIDCPAAPPSNPPSTPPSNPPSTPPSNPPSTPPSTPPSQAPSEEPTSSVLPIESTQPQTQPSGDVLGVVGTPRVTPPPTDAVSDATTSSGSWRIVLAGMAILIVTALLFTQPTRARRSR